MSTYQDKNLSEWIEIGIRCGKIRSRQTVALAYIMEDVEALPWIADIVLGTTTEYDALIFMRRAIQYSDYDPSTRPVEAISNSPEQSAGR